MSEEDRRSAAILAAGLSTTLAGSCLSIMGIVGAAWLFIVDKRTLSPTVEVLFVVSLALFFLSLYFGSRGIATIYKQGHAGDWTYLAGDTCFQRQVFAAIGAILVLVGGLSIIGPPRQQETEIVLAKRVDSLTTAVHLAAEAHARLRNELDSLRTAISRRLR